MIVYIASKIRPYGYSDFDVFINCNDKVRASFARDAEQAKENHPASFTYPHKVELTRVRQ